MPPALTSVYPVFTLLIFTLRGLPIEWGSQHLSVEIHELLQCSSIGGRAVDACELIGRGA